MSTEVLTGPQDSDYEAFYPLAQLKKDLVIASDTQDEKLRVLLRAAVRIAGQAARCVILPTTIRTTLKAPYARGDSFGLRSEWVDRDRTIEALTVDGPLYSITSIFEGAAEIPSNRYQNVSDSNAKGIGRIGWLKEDGITRLPFRYASGDLTVEHVSGFTQADDLKTIRIAVYEIIANWYQNPGSAEDMKSIPCNATLILSAYWSSRTNRRRFG